VGGKDSSAGCDCLVVKEEDEEEGSGDVG